jgi:hypothetical protein
LKLSRLTPQAQGNRFKERCLTAQVRTYDHHDTGRKVERHVEWVRDVRTRLYAAQPKAGHTQRSRSPRDVRVGDGVRGKDRLDLGWLRSAAQGDAVDQWRTLRGCHAAPA